MGQNNLEINKIKCKNLKNNLSCELFQENDLLVDTVKNVKLIHVPTEVKTEYKSVSDGFEIEINEVEDLRCQIEKNGNSNRILCR